MRPLLSLSFSLVLVTAAGAEAAHAQCACPGGTHVAAGTVSGQTWTAAGSPYCVDGDLLVDALTIGPGVSVELCGDHEIEVSGVLSAVGSLIARIRFTLHPDNSAGQWQGLYFNNGLPGSELAHTIVEHAATSGITIENTLIDLRDCEIRDNTGIPNGGGISTDSPLTVERCHFEGNRATDGSPGPSLAAGGAIHSTAELTIADSSFVLNDAFALGVNTIIEARGGAIHYDGPLLRLTGSELDRNAVQTANAGQYPLESRARGGAIYLTSEASASIQNAFITCNRVRLPARESPEPPYPGGIYAGSATLRVLHSTLAGNANEEIWLSPSGFVLVENSIVWDRFFGHIEGPATVSFSDVKGGFAGEGNISVDPEFVNPRCPPLGGGDAIDVHVLPTSPVIDSASADAPGVPDDDIDGDPRPFEDGFDMGADEAVPRSAVPALSLGARFVAALSIVVGVSWLGRRLRRRQRL